jgi:phage tail-like protein
MPTGERRQDPYLSFRFLVEIQGLVVGGFSEVSGLSAETEFDEQREGGVNEFVHKFPKLTKYPNLTLKRGITDSDKLWQWHHDVTIGKVQRTTIHLVLLDSEGNEKWRWSFENAYPVKWIGPELKSDGSAVALESLEIAHNGFSK